MVIALVVTELLNAGMKNSRLEGMENGTEEKKEEKQPATNGETEPPKPSTDEKKGEGSKEASKDKDQSPTPEEVKKVQNELVETQEKIIQGFQSIEPYMNQAEGLVEKMNKYANA